MSYHGGKIGKARGTPVLIDVDGVIANFCDGVTSYIERRFGIKVDQSKIFGDVRDEANGLWDDECEEHIKAPGFARRLKEYPGAVDAVKQIMETYDVVFVTSPYPYSDTWCQDRFMWLRDRFQIGRDDVIFARDKRFVHGLTLIDDRPENVADWSAYWQKYSILMSRPWNKSFIDDADERSGDTLFYRGRSNIDSAVFALDDWNKIMAHLETMK